MYQPEGLPPALGEWTALLGRANVITDEAVLDAAGTATFATPSRVLTILRPATRDEVQACLAIANRHGVPISPISSGKNWGYGSRAPVSDAVLLDLSRLNRIVDFDETLAYVTIEPGVTQRHLFTFLAERQSQLWMDATGASPDCSIIGNTMERGFGHTPMGDHCANACGFEVVLPDGSCIETGFGRFEGARTVPLSRYGVGPALDGLFSQSNLGIVTRMTVWLMPRPEHFQAFFWMCNDPDGLPAIVDALRPLRLDGTLRSVMHIGNDYKVLAATGRYPWDETGGRVPLEAEVMDRLRKRFKIGHWTGSGGLYGSKGQVREARRLLKAALNGKVDRLQFVDDRLIALMERFQTPFKLVTGWDIGRTLSVLRPVYNLLKGTPTDDTLSSSYWRTRGPVPSKMDPDLDGCGLLWFAPVVPNTGEHAKVVTELAGRILLSHGFEPQMSISLASERTMICVITISFDRRAAGEDDRAIACYHELSDRLIEAGYPPYRLSTISTALPSEGAFADAVRRLKHALDPNGILAPGRYAPGAPTRPAAAQAVTR
jgi:4-cresol dehydrogenase (hydroxylating)